MDKRTQARLRKSAADKAEEDGIVADSKEVRMDLMRRVRDGEITLDAAQSDLKRIKRNAKKNGQITRNRAYLGGA